MRWVLVRHISDSQDYHVPQVKEEEQKERIVVTVQIGSIWWGKKKSNKQKKKAHHKQKNVLILSNYVTQVSCISSSKKQTSLILPPCCNQLHPKISGGKMTSDTAMVKMTQTKKWQLWGCGKVCKQITGCVRYADTNIIQWLLCLSSVNM